MRTGQEALRLGIRPLDRSSDDRGMLLERTDTQWLPWLEEGRWTMLGLHWTDRTEMPSRAAISFMCSGASSSLWSPTMTSWPFAVDPSGAAFVYAALASLCLRSLVAFAFLASRSSSSIPTKSAGREVLGPLSQGSYNLGEGIRWEWAIQQKAAGQL